MSSTKQDVRDNTDGLSTYQVTMANGRTNTMTRDCLLHCHLDSASPSPVKSWKLDVDSVVAKPHICDFGETTIIQT